MSLFVLPGVGDTVREPQWYWAAAGAVPLAVAHFRHFERAHWARLARSLPLALWAWVAFLLVRLAWGGFQSAHVLVLPALIAVGALAVWCSPVPLPARKLRAVLAAVITLQLLWGVLQALGHDPVFARADISGLNPHLPAGFLGQHTLFGLLMAWAATCWLLERRWIPALVCAVAVLSTGSAFSLASLAAGALWAAFCFGYRKSSAVAAGLGVLAACFLFQADLDRAGDYFFSNGRIEIWVITLKAWRDHPWMGHGLGAFSHTFAPYYQGIGGFRWREAHNEWLEYLFNAGIVGWLFLVPFLATLAIRAAKLPPSPARNLAIGTLLVIGVNTLGNFSLQIAPFASAAIYAAAWVFTRTRA